MEDFWRQESSVWSKNDIITWTANFHFHLSFRTDIWLEVLNKKNRRKYKLNTSMHGKPSISQLASTHICFLLYVTGLEDQKCTLRDSCIFQALIVVLIFYTLKSEFSLAQLLYIIWGFMMNSVSCLLNHFFSLSYWHNSFCFKWCTEVGASLWLLTIKFLASLLKTAWCGLLGAVWWGVCRT